MSAYGFKARWEAPLRALTKLTTLRVDRVDGRIPRVGQKFSAFFGMRTKQCRRLFDSTIESVDRIVIVSSEYGETASERARHAIFRNGQLLRLRPANKLAVDDGFEDLDDLLSFFEAEHAIHLKPFRGWLIRWAQPVTWA